MLLRIFYPLIKLHLFSQGKKTDLCKKTHEYDSGIRLANYSYKRSGWLK